MQFRPAQGERSLGGAEAATSGRRTRELLERAAAFARRLAARPYRAIALLLALDLALIGIFAALGELVFSDPAELFRELMPGTLLSVAQIGFIAVIAWTIHRQLHPGSRLRLDNFWGISVLVFAVFAVDEATQATIYLADALAALGTLAPAGFRDLDAFLVTVLLVAGGAALLRYGWTLWTYPNALALLIVGVGFAAASQTLDSVLKATSSEFVAEESLKLTAEPFLIGGYLLVLATVLRQRPHVPDALRPAPGSTSGV